MITTVAGVSMPLDESLKIQKNRIMPEEGKNGGKRISIVTGIHGDELEGQYVCFELIRRIEEHKELLTGIVDVYPAMNPLGIDSVTRGIPAFDLDMNRLFPGNTEGSMTEFLAAEIVKDLYGSDMCIDIHASNIYLTEIPQVRINELHKEMLVPYAKLLNVDFIWVHGANTVLESTLAHSLNSKKIPTLVVEMGVGMRITKAYCNQLVDGIFCLMAQMGIWQGETITPREPVVADDNDDVCFLNASVAGVFVQEARHWEKIHKGEHIGDIINPLTGKVSDRIISPVDGILFTVREYPIVDEGSLIGRILKW